MAALVLLRPRAAEGRTRLYRRHPGRALLRVLLWHLSSTRWRAVALLLLLLLLLQKKLG